MVAPEEITIESVLETLDNLDDEQKQSVKAAADKQATDAVAAAKKQAEEEAKARQPETKKKAEKPEQDAATRMAWSLSEDYVKDTCPDLDAETLEIVKAAAGEDPVAFKNKAKQMQAKLAAAKKPLTPEDEAERKKRELAEQVFDGGGKGGDKTVAQAPPKATVQEDLKKAIDAKDRKGIVKSVARAINEGKVFERGVGMVIE